MKKALSLLLVTGVLGSLQAQTTAPAKPKCITVSSVKNAQNRIKAQQAGEKSVGTQASANQNRRIHRIASEPNLPFLGSSANVNGVLDATTTAVTANQPTDLIVMTHRDNYSNVATCGTGAYISAFSINNGTTWDSTVTTFCNSANGPGTRYPNGVIFNPANGTATPNTNPVNTYDVMSGPFTNGSATGDSWVTSVYGSVQLTDPSGSNDHGMYWANGTPGTLVQNNGDLSFMSSSDDSTVHVIGEGFNLDASGNFTAWRGAVLTTGKFDAAADSFKWTQTLFRPHIVPSYKGFTVGSVYDSDAAPLTVPGTAWSQDGKTGYVVFFANADSTGYNYTTDQPIIYKTTDAGQTWGMMPLYNFRNIPSLTQHLEATTDSAGVKIPIWLTFEVGNTASQGAVDGYDLTVDYQGNLHIFGAVVSSYYCNPDSGYTVHFFSNQTGYIYDVSTSTPTGGWKARFIDSLNTLPCADAGLGLNPNGNPDWDSSSASFVGFGARIQASRTMDGKRIFCTWEDDLSGGDPGFLVFPDVYGEGYNIPKAKAGHVEQFTNTSNNYFLCVSDIALESVVSGDSTFTVPCTIAYPQQTPNDGSLPINYYYLGTVVYNDSLNNSASVPTIADKGFTISQNFPNPFSNTTQFNITMPSDNVVSVEVYNLFGQKIYSIPTQQLSAGIHLMTINASGWSAGVYFYRVTVGDKSVTQKMMVK